jgi:hypothetical protein
MTCPPEQLVQGLQALASVVLEKVACCSWP